ncbi:MAG: SDR family oxidoreductase [Candidatus Bathyarchaeota archaeon]|nr:SDR family oxidoreductase [Candidatus Bathyarchaeota archaeon]
MTAKKKVNLTPLPELISLKGKKALITGAGAGIGKAMAYRFAEAGAALDLADVNEQSLRLVKTELKHFSTKVNIHKVDLSKKEEIDMFWKKLEGKEPDILINNAGIYPAKPFLEVDEAFLKKVMDINLNSVFWMCQNMIRSRLKKGGVIINLGSIEAIMPFKDELCHYDITKAGIMVLSRTLANEYGRKGFRINVLVPGGIWTSGTRNVAKEALQFKLGIIKSGIKYNLRNPMGRLGKPDEVARMALVLASDLSSYVHGTLIAVDGGFLSA